LPDEKKTGSAQRSKALTFVASSPPEITAGNPATFPNYYFGCLTGKWK